MSELGQKAIHHAFHTLIEWARERMGEKEHEQTEPVRGVCNLEGRIIPYISYEKPDGSVEMMVFYINGVPVTLDHKVEKPHPSVTVTHLRLSTILANSGELGFTIYRKGILSGLGKLFGMQDIEVGHADFDDQFIIKSNNVEKARAFFGDETIRRLLLSLPQLNYELKDNALTLLMLGQLAVKLNEEQFSSLPLLFARTLDLLSPPPAKAGVEAVAKPAKKTAAKKRTVGVSKAKSKSKKGTSKAKPATSSAKKRVKKS